MHNQQGLEIEATTSAYELREIVAVTLESNQAKQDTIQGLVFIAELIFYVHGDLIKVLQSQTVEPQCSSDVMNTSELQNAVCIRMVQWKIGSTVA